MTEREQREVLEHVRATIKRTWLRHCLTVKITRKRATYDRPAEWRMWVYVKGLPKVLEDGCSNGYLLRAENYDDKAMAQKLVSIAMTSPFAKDYIQTPMSDSKVERSDNATKA